ncbi:MAG: NADH-quinone oxidoreductase subunit L [bacterium]
MPTIEHITWILLFSPLVAALGILLFTRRAPTVSAAVSIGAALVSFAASVKLFLVVAGGTGVVIAPHIWLSVGTFTVEWGAVVDRLSVLMLLVVTGVGSAIQIYSVGYMKGDSGISRYFAYMSLFTFSMLGVVLSPNFIQMFMFWELVGVSSYLLIGFWFERPAAAAAGQKAFIVNRIGDAGLILGILTIWACAGTFDFAELAGQWQGLGLTPLILAAAAGLVFCGAAGKSAQVPLHVWLPDAMEGPTPVSALIHAATMVAAGVYMLCRVSWLITASPMVMTGIAWIGGVTALMAALIALTQSDIKRILAYSTLSQLGYMMMAVGLGGSTEAMFHLTTHAFFKALLFLSAGSVIMALHHEQDIWKMGGLRKRMPLTFGAFLIGTLALGGIWPLSGYYSKDEILLLALEQNTALLVVGLVTAFLTALYMGRLLWVVFFGEARDRRLAGHAGESPWVVTLPLVFLAVLSVVGGWYAEVPRFLSPEYHAVAYSDKVMAGFLAVPVIGFLLAWRVYGKAPADDAVLRKGFGPCYRLMESKFYFDECYGWLIENVQGGAALVCETFDRWIICGAGVGGLTGTARMLGWAVRTVQSGDLRFTLFVTGAGVVALLLWLLAG